MLIMSALHSISIEHASLDFHNASSLHDSPWVDMLLHLDTLSWCHANLSLVLFPKAACCVEATNTNLKIFG